MFLFDLATALKGRPDRSSERLSDFPKVTQLVKAEPRVDSSACDSLHLPRCTAALFSHFMEFNKLQLLAAERPDGGEK